MQEPTSLSAWAGTIATALKDAGVDAEAAFSEANMDWSLLSDPYARYPASNMMQLWRIAVRQTGDPAFGLKAVEQMGPTNFYELSVAILASKTFGDALQKISEYGRFGSNAVEYVIKRGEDSLQMALQVPDHGIPLEYEAYDTALGIVEKTRLLLNPGGSESEVGCAPLTVELMRPLPEDPSPWENFFQSPIEFGAKRNCLHYSNEGVDALLPGANRHLELLNEQFVESYLVTLEKHPPFAARVSSYIVQRLPSGRPALDDIADELSLSRSALQRKLGKEKVTFNALLDEARRNLAEKYLLHTDLSISEITYLLGFSDQGNFTHSFKRWYDTTPSKYRAEQEAA